MKHIKDIEKSWENIGISNDFLFVKVMQDPELCQEMLQRILPDLEIDHIEYPEPQKSINPDLDARGIRLDIYVRGNDGAAYVVDYSDFRFIPINLFKDRFHKTYKQVYRNNCFNNLVQVD